MAKEIFQVAINSKKLFLLMEYNVVYVSFLLLIL